MGVCISGGGSAAAALDPQESVIAFVDFTGAEPAAPADGDRYISTGTGIMSITSQSVTTHNIYRWNAGAGNWDEIVPDAGFNLWSTAGGRYHYYNGTSWSSAESNFIFANLLVQDGVPSFRLRDTLSTSTEQSWLMQPATDQFLFKLTDDSFGSPVTALTIDRTGTTPDLMTINMNQLIEGDAVSRDLTVRHYGLGLGPDITLSRALGTKSSPIAVTSSDSLGKINGEGYDGTSFVVGAQIQFIAEENWASTDNGASIRFNVNAVGDSTPAEAMIIDQTGFVGIGNNAAPAEIFHVQKSTDGDVVAGIFENSQANTGSSSNETVSIKFRFGGADAADILIRKNADFTTGANEDAWVDFRSAANGSLTTAFQLRETSVVFNKQIIMNGDQITIQRVNTGLSHQLILLEASANTAASIDEVSSIDFKFDTLEAAMLVVGKESDFTSVANEDSFMAFFTVLNGTTLEAARFGSNGDLTMRSGSDVILSGGAELTGLPSIPTLATSAISKAFFDSQTIKGAITKANVIVTTTADITLSGEQTIDSILTSTDRVLVKDQSDATENGIYVSAAGAWTRSTDLDNSPSSEIFNGVWTYVDSGTIGAGGSFRIISTGTGTDDVHTIGVDDIDWADQAIAIIAGDGIDRVGQTLSVDFNAINLQITATELNTIQDIATTSSPSFTNLMVSGGILSLGETTAPSATSGFGKLFVKSSDSLPYFLDDSGSEFPLTTSSITVDSKTEGVGAPYDIVVADDLKVFTNEGATAEVYLNLPTAVAGLSFNFVCQDTDGIRIIANTGDTIRLGVSVTAAAGNIKTFTVGNTIKLVAINATEWMAIASTGDGAWEIT